MGIVGLPDSFELNVRELDLLYNVAATDASKLNWDDLTSDAVAVRALRGIVDGTLERVLVEYLLNSGGQETPLQAFSTSALLW